MLICFTLSDLSKGPFTVTVSSCGYATRVTIGTFSGMAFKPNGDTVYVSGRQYKVPARR
ncbi:MAG TPA: hypothetical protein VG847_04295 [Chitinophagaceae bacterium]|nr:hypothetical protein [Chitinophagaceae bacterium]